MEITIIIPTYKRSTTIGYCLNSVIKQTFTDFECLIVDYREDDLTKKVVDYFTDQDKRFKYIESKRKGAMAQRELGIKRSSGKYICFIDSDDLVNCNYVFMLYNTLKKEQTDFVFGTIKEFKSYSEKLGNALPVNDWKIDVIKGSQYRNIVKSFRRKMTSPTPVCLMSKRDFFIKACKYYNYSLNIKYYEDSILSYFIWFNSKSVTLIRSDAIYYYISYKNVRGRNVNDLKFYQDCYKVSYHLTKIISESNYPRYYKQASFYGTISLMFQIMMDNEMNRTKFRLLKEKFNEYVPSKNIKISMNDYLASEKLLALSIKFNCFLLIKLTKKILYIKRKLKKFKR